ncbi:MAG TPA: flagellar basal body rod protein FlgC [Clostridiales bacterium]|nr:flagellar basal body rod protein FlgC [Clostridiales bacterium]
MAFLDSLNISGSALTAARLRMDIISQNIANQNTTRTEAGGPYRRKMVVYQAEEADFESMLQNKIDKKVGGVKVAQIVEDQTPFTPVYNPSHPDADENGYVYMPNVDPVQEVLDFMETTAMYNANLTALEAIKNMALKALEIGK